MTDPTPLDPQAVKELEEWARGFDEPYADTVLALIEQVRKLTQENEELERDCDINLKAAQESELKVESLRNQRDRAEAMHRRLAELVNDAPYMTEVKKLEGQRDAYREVAQKFRTGWTVADWDAARAEFDALEKNQ